MASYEDRFGGVGRIVSPDNLEKLRKAHVCVVGIGGVGSWAVEALVRSGVGRLTLIDMDEVCVSNINRQLHALEGDIGRSKVEVMAERAKNINPECEVTQIHRFFTDSNAEEILANDYDAVIDAIDSISPKCLLLALCVRKQIPVFASGGAGGRIDPSRIEIADLSKTYGDALLASVRKKLRYEHGFPKGEKRKFKIPAVFSSELPVDPRPFVQACEGDVLGGGTRMNCQSGFGSAVFVTGTFGFQLASLVVQKLVK